MSVKYKEIASEIEAQLLAGKYNEGKKLPTEEELIDQYQVSRTTIRKAIGILVNKGYVYQIQGSGIFVREAALKDYISLENLKGLSRDFPQKKIISQLIELSIVSADEDLATKMKCPIYTPLYFVKRLRIIDGRPFVLEYSYFNKDIIPYLNEEIVKNSIYSYIKDDLKLSIGFADKVIYADKLDADCADALGLEVGDPGLVIDQTVFLSRGDVFEISRVIHHYEQTKLLKLANF